jgi:hypothetical protein
MSSAQFPSVAAPPGWEWQGPWRVERGLNTDPDGWSYAVDFAMLQYPFHSGAQKRSLAHFVRRRRWVRRRQRVTPARTARPAASGDNTSARSSGDRGEQTIVLGLLPAQHRMLVPLHLLDISAELVMRPCLPEQEAGEAEPSAAPASASNASASREVFEHHWSAGASGGSHNVVLNIDALEATAARLLSCRAETGGLPAGTPKSIAATVLPKTAAVGVAPFDGLADVRRSTCFIALAVEATPLANAGASELDWQITLWPPLTVSNLLPVPASYTVFELPGPSAANATRQSGTVGAGAAVAVYAADVRRTVSLKFVPHGYEWEKPSAVILAAGFASATAGVGGAAVLPQTLSVSNANTKVALHVHIEREVAARVSGTTAGNSSRAGGGGSGGDERGQGLADEVADIGGQLAMGGRMLVRLYVQLWVLNTTQVRSFAPPWLVLAALFAQQPQPVPAVAELEGPTWNASWT